MQFLLASGKKVTYCEGGALRTLIYCACFDRLHDLALAHFGDEETARSYMYTSILVYAYFLEANPSLPMEMIADVASAQESDVMRAFDKLKGWHGTADGWAFRDWIGVDRDFVRRLFSVLGGQKAAVIMTHFLSDPYAYSKGWPDLVWVSHGTFGLIEVKTTDRLHWSQIVTISDLCQEADLPVEVYQVARLNLLEDRIPSTSS